MKKTYRTFLSGLYKISFAILIAVSFVPSLSVASSTDTIPAGSAIINMGVIPQTYENGLLPYGMVNALVKQKVPVTWAFDPNKPLFGTDFTVNSTDFNGTPLGAVSYMSSAFIIQKEFIDADSAKVWAILNQFAAAGVVINFNTEDLVAPVHGVITTFPKAVLDFDNGSLIIDAFYKHAFLDDDTAATTYRLGRPSSLSTCDDLFALPHADPHLPVSGSKGWNLNDADSLKAFVQNGGFFWSGCHAVSGIETYANTAGHGSCVSNLNFLTNGGTSPWSNENNCGYTPHANKNSAGSTPFLYNNNLGNHFITQIANVHDEAYKGGSEKIYLAHSDALASGGIGGWRNTTQIFIEDTTFFTEEPDDTAITKGEAAIVAFGRAYGNMNYGMVLYQTSHDIASGNEQEDVAAARMYGNFLLEAGLEEGVQFSNVNIPSLILVGDTPTLSATIQGGMAPFTVSWSSDCGGTFTNPNGFTTDFIPPAGFIGSCIITLEASDACSNTRTNFTSELVEVTCATKLVRKDTTICPGDSIYLEGAFQTTAATYRDTFSLASGCDSICITDLMVADNPPVAVCKDITVYLNVAGEASIAPADIDGGSTDDCSIDLINADITFFSCASLGPNSATLTVIDINGSVDTCMGTVTVVDTLSPQALCQDISVTLNGVGLASITANQIDNGSTDACGVDALSVNPSTFTCDNAGLNTVIMMVADGSGNESTCSATVTVIDTTEIVLTAFTTTCNANEAGTDTLFFTNQFGCDSLVIIHTSLLPGNETNLNATTCNPAEAGTDTVIFTNQLGCDSLVITATTLLPGDETHFTATTCDPNSAGVDTLILTNQLGCDSLIIITTALLPSDFTNLSRATCNPDLAGVDTVFLTNEFGCDSLVITSTFSWASPPTIFETYTCNPDSANADTVVFNNQLGCDSLVITTTVLATDEIIITEFTCDPLAVGADTAFYTNRFGCDSIEITYMILAPTDTTHVSATTCLVSEVGLDIALLSNQFGCDSFVITTTTLLPVDETTFVFGTCNAADAGIDTLILTNQAGCDSLVIVINNLLPSDMIMLTQTSCDTFDVGVDTIELTNRFGCDSLIITTTTLVANDETILSEHTCDPNEAGIDTTFLFNQFGCDSLVITTTTLHPSDTVMLIETTCDAQFLSEDTTYLSNRFGCDSLIILTTLVADTCGDLVSTLNASSVSCNGLNDGAIDLTVTGGVSPYTITWSDGSIAEDISNLPPGIYSVTVTDFAGNGDTVATIISEPPALQISSLIKDATCHGDADGNIDLTVNGGIPPYTYLWTTPTGTSGDEDLQNLIAGLYHISVTDAIGCSIMATDTIKEPSAILPVITADGPTEFCVNDSIQLTASANPLLTNLSYQWSSGNAGTVIRVTASATITITVTNNDNGCTDVATINVNEISLPADFNFDGVVNNIDFLQLVGVFNLSCNGCPEDLNGDGFVNNIDFLILVGDFNKTCQDVFGQ